MLRTMKVVPLLLACAAAFTTAHAEEARNIAADVLSGLRGALNQKDNQLAPVLKELIGKDGGNSCFYFPTHDEPCTPATYGYRYQEIRFASRDGTKLHGWFLPAATKHPKGTIVFSHGNAGSLGHHLGFIEWWVDAGYNVMMYDYRGFGKSAGAPDRRGMVDDVKAAFAFVKTIKGVDPARLVSFGHSLGGAKSVAALAESPVPGVCAIITDGGFASYKTMAKLMGGDFAKDLVSDDLAPASLVRKLSPVPLLVVHGTDDEVVPVSEGRALFAAAAQPKTFFEIKNGHHGDSLWRENGAYRRKTLAWLDRVMPPRAIAVR